MNYWCAKCGGVFDPATVQSIADYLCTCPKEETSASNNAIPMTPETPSLTPTPLTDNHAVGAIGFYSCATVPASLARTLETRALSAEADNARLRGVLEKCREALQRHQLLQRANAIRRHQVENYKNCPLSQITDKAMEEAAAILSKP